MKEEQRYRAIIPPIPDGVNRPLWSVMIPTYNCAQYLREALASVLAQDPGPEMMQIEVVDDCSTRDDPAAVVAELGRGRVAFYRQPKNVGYIRNFETCLQRARGHLIHLLHGDDYVKNGFYAKLQLAFEENLEIGAAFCRHMYMDDNDHWHGLSTLERPERGILNNWLEHIAIECRIQTPAIVVRREVYERLGGFDRRFSCCGEDWEMWVRIAAHYPIWYEPEPLAVYRIRSMSLSRLSARSGADIRDIRMAIEMFRPYLPVPIADKLTKKARENWALYAVRNLAPGMLAIGDIHAASLQIQEALKCSHSMNVIKHSAPLLLQIWKARMKFAQTSAI
jgi:GT2 family glycosyltransferase